MSISKSLNAQGQMIDIDIAVLLEHLNQALTSVGLQASAAFHNAHDDPGLHSH